MTNETLRMQMLAGVITEGEYKAKLQENKKKKSLKESMIGGIVGIGAINQIPPRAKADYETAFEHFLGGKYGLKENEEMITPKTLANYIMDMIELADDMEYTLKMVDELKNLKNTLSGGSMSKEDALKVMQKTIDITGDDIDAAEALNQAISGDYKLNERETKFENREQDPYTMKEAEMPAIDPKIANDPAFQKLSSYFKQNPDEAKDVKNELSSLEEAYEKDGKYYDEEYGHKKEVTFKEYLIAKLVNIGLPAVALGFVGALMAGPLGAMAPAAILQAIGIAAGIGGAAGAALDYGETKPIGEVEEVNEGEQTIRSKSIKDYILSQIKLYPMYSAQLKSFESTIKNNQDLTKEEAKEIIEKFIKITRRTEDVFDAEMKNIKNIDYQTDRDQMAAIQGGYY